MAEEVTPEVISAGMAVASIIADVIDRLHTRTDPLIDPLLFLGTNLTSKWQLGARAKFSPKASSIRSNSLHHRCLEAANSW
jgi:hypothetical protein